MSIHAVQEPQCVVAGSSKGSSSEVNSSPSTKNEPDVYESAGCVYLSSPCRHFQPAIFQKLAQNRQMGVIQNLRFFPGFSSPEFSGDPAWFCDNLGHGHNAR